MGRVSRRQPQTRNQAESGTTPSTRFTRQVLAGATLAATLVVGIASVGMVTTLREVHVERGGVTRPVTVQSMDPEAVLDAAGMSLTPYDTVQDDFDSANSRYIVREAHQVSMVGEDGTLDRKWTTASSVVETVKDQANTEDIRVALPTESPQSMPVVDQTSPAKLLVDGKELSVTVTAGADINQVVADAGVELQPLDRVTLGIGEDGIATVQVTRVERELEKRSTAIPHPVKEIKDDSRYEGEKEVVTPGKDGEIVEEVFEVRVDGEVVHSSTLSSQRTKEPVEEVVEVGTKQLPVGLTPEQMELIASSGGGSVDDYKAIARTMLTEFGFADDQFGCLDYLWTRESHWNPRSLNSSSGAYGIPQALPGSKMASAGADWLTNPATQIRWGLGYVRSRYGTPCGAVEHFNSYNWY